MKRVSPSTVAGYLAGVTMLAICSFVGFSRPATRLVPKQEVCQDRTAEAWQKALEVAGVPKGSDVPHWGSLRILYEPRFLPWNGYLSRICGLTEWYFIPVEAAEGKVGFEPHADVSLFIIPGDCETAFNTLVHEFLHVIHAYISGGPTSDEQWVRDRWPAECN